MKSSLSLSIVIPVWNLPGELTALLGQVAKCRMFDEIIVCDDASQPPCDPATLGFSEETLGARLVYLRSDEQRGAGNARNQGLAAVSSDFMLFFDADDQLNPEITEIWATVQAHAQSSLHGSPLDFAIFRHADTRMGAANSSFLHDEHIWDRTLGQDDAKSLSKVERAHLSGIAAYPWNKFYRTEFLRDNKIRCTESPVHNDIALHWLSFLDAKHVLAIRALGATHVVGKGGHHLTNRLGEDRFCVFGILGEVFAKINSTPEQAPLYSPTFIHFAFDLCRWISNRVDIEARDRFCSTAREFLLSNISRNEFATFALWHPEKAEALVCFLSGRQDL